MPVETERKFSMNPGDRVPDLTGLAEVTDSRRFQLNATYFDTPKLTLARNAITLRRRTGGGDAGWHLKLPRGGDDRLEVHEPITRGSSTLLVPAPLRTQVADIVGYEPLLPVANLATRRTESNLVRDGKVLATLCDDTVTATRDGVESRWRELEVELTEDSGAAGRALLDEVTARFGEGGVPVAESVSKLVQALGDKLSGELPPLTRKATSARVLGSYLADQVGAIQGREAAVREDAPDAVHKMRVATRRLRSALRTFRPLLDAETSEPLRAELKWLGEMLGGPRDAEVLRDRLLAEVADLPPETVVGPVAKRLTSELTASHDRTHQELVKALDSARFRRVGEALVRLVAEPPFVEYAEARAKGALPPLLERTARRVLKQARRAARSEDPEAQLDLWHETRKRAKAARYAWEALTPAFGSPASERASAWEQVTESLGTVQDTVVARQRLIELAEAAHKASESTFTYGVLWGRQTERAQAAQDTADATLRAAKAVAKL